MATLDPDSLARVFLHAGVPHIVVSLWNVDSTAAWLFMQSFYQALLSGKTPAAASQASEQKLRERAGMAHPYYWAAFHVFGQS